MIVNLTSSPVCCAPAELHRDHSVYEWGRFEASYAVLTAALASRRPAAEETR